MESVTSRAEGKNNRIRPPMEKDPMCRLGNLGNDGNVKGKAEEFERTAEATNTSE